jgi:hypothetical protein
MASLASRTSEVLVDNYTLDEEGVLKSATNLAVNLDQLEVDVLPVEVGNGQHGVDGDLCELVVGLGNNLRSE